MKFQIMPQAAKMALFIFCITAGMMPPTKAQTPSDSLITLVRKGVAYQDAKDYESALKMYNQALKLDKKSALVHYEMAYTYFSMKNYKQAIKHIEKSIKGDTIYQKHSYVLYGSSLDNLGRKKEAIKVFKEGISKYPDNYLLYYNLGLTYYQSGIYDEAEKHLIQGIRINPLHASSHLVLSNVMRRQNKRIYAVLPLYYFLFLEPQSERSTEIWASLTEMLEYGVTRKDSKNIQVSLSSAALDTGGLGSAEMALALLAAKKTGESGKEKTNHQLFSELTQSFFLILGETRNARFGFWRDFYIDFYYAMAKAEQSEFFCYHIMQARKDGVSEQWLRDHAESQDHFIDWLKSYLNPSSEDTTQQTSD